MTPQTAAARLPVCNQNIGSTMKHELASSPMLSPITYLINLLVFKHRGSFIIQH